MELWPPDRRLHFAAIDRASPVRQSPGARAARMENRKMKSHARVVVIGGGVVGVSTLYHLAK